MVVEVRWKIPDAKKSSLLALLKSALAMTMYRPACSALVIQAFCPLSTQWSPVLSALLVRAKASLPQ